jgi:hypothetical protein
MAFLKDIISRLSRGPESASDAAADSPASPKIRLAVFGKHPAWNDHIDDIGLDTDRLVAFKRAFYLQGVSANLDSGTWEGLTPAQRLNRFDHLLLQRTGSGWIIGRAVASTDGKGRGRYPLVACAQCTGVPLARIASAVAPLLEDFLARCAQTADRAQVMAILDDTHTKLDEIAAPNPPPLPGDGDAPTAPPAVPTLADLVACPDLGENGAKLYSVLYQAEREMKAYAPADGPPKTIVPAPAAHLRVPTCAVSAAHGARLWTELLTARLSAGAPVLAVVAVSAGWIDLLVGDTGPRDFFCLLASREMVPFTTDIPFNMDDAFLARASRLVAELSKTQAPSQPPPALL